MKGRKMFVRKQQEGTPAFALVSAKVLKNRENPAMRYLVQALILGMGIFGCSYSFLSAFGITLYTSALPVWMVLFVAITVGIYSFSSWPFLLLIPGVPLALWAFLDFDGIRNGFVLVLNRVLLVMSQNSPWTFTQFQLDLGRYYHQAVWLETRFLVLLFCILILITGFFVVRRPTMIGLIICTAPFLAYPLFFTLMPDLPPFFALLASWMMQYTYIGRYQVKTLRHSRPKKQGVLFQGNVRRQSALLMMGCMLISAVTSIAILPQQDYQRPANIDALQEQLFNFPQSLVHLFGGGADKDLHNLGQLRFSGETAIEVLSTADEPKTLYLRGYAANSYDGNGWSIADDSAYQQASQQFTQWQGETVSPMNYYGLLGLQTASYTLQVRNIVPNHDSIFVPAYLKDNVSEISGANFRQDLFVQRGWNSPTEYTLETFIQPDSWSCLLHVPMEGNRPGVPEEFQVQSGDALQSLTTSYAAYIYEPYTRLPENTRQAALQWCEEHNIESFTNIPDYEISYDSRTVAVETLCQQIQSVFRGEYTYTYSPPSFPQGREFIQWFSETKTGYCVHFATAGVLLLRALGIPARYAEGYIITTDDWENGQRTKDGYLQVPDSHSHAWVEVYDADDGVWVPVEMTPGFHEDDFWESPSQSGSPSPEPTPTPEQTAEPTETPEATQTPVPSETPENTLSPTLAPDDVGEGIGTGWLYSILAWLGIFLLLAAVVIFRRKWHLFCWRKQWKQQDVREGIRAYWRWTFEILGCAGLTGWNQKEPEKSLHTLKESCPWIDESLFRKAYEIGKQARFGKDIPKEEDRYTMEMWAAYLRKNLVSRMSTARKFKCRWLKCLL